MASRLLACLLVGLGSGLAEALVVGAFDGRMFLSYREVLRLGAATMSVGGMGTMVAGLPWVLAPRFPDAVRRHGGWIVGGLSLPGFVVAAQLLTAGRRVADASWRPLAVAALALLAAAALVGTVRLVDRALRPASARSATAVASLLAGAVVCCTVADSLVLRRLYPAFHWSLSLLTLFLNVQLARVAAGQLRQRLLRAAPALLASSLLLGPLVLRSVTRAPSLRFSIEQTAPVSGKLLSLLPRPAPLEVAVPQPVLQAPPASRAAGPAPIALRAQDVLLVTVDALRADALAAYGGKPGLTPAIDALARESLVFERAYTPTPHTSYALTSLMTGKYMREVAALAGETGPRDGDADTHPTLATLLRRYGYRTAAFYPPAVFFVDGARFEGFRRTQLGFEYAKVMFADASERVTQVKAYLDDAPSEHPLFLWVHLFEPHEPYDPPPAFERGRGPRARYDGEVAAADDAIGKLVALFRARRPGATVIVSADHGEEFDEHGGRRHGSSLYDEQVRVPLVWSSPGAVPPGRAAGPVDLVDVSTTLLSALGMPPDARMRGDDLTGVLADVDGARAPVADAGGETVGPIAYAALDAAQMACDGRFKVICHRRGHCQLFDLETDPAELRDRAGESPSRVVALRSALAALSASIPRVEALALGDAAGFPEALSRARIGDPSAAPALLPLLGSPREEVRAAAAEACAELHVAAAVPVLARLRRDDPARAVRAGAAVAGLRLGDRGALAEVRALLLDAEAVEAGHPGASGERVLRRRAALALVGAGDAAGLQGVAAIAGDDGEPEQQRLAAIAALGELGDPRAVTPLIALMPQTRLRPAVSTALGRLGGPRAVAALAKALQGERYPESRAAEVAALIAVGHPSAVSLLVRFLGTDTSVPDGLKLLLRAGASLRCGADLRDGWPHGALPAAWRCEGGGCTPGQGATLPVPGRGERRLLLRLEGVAPGASMRVGEVDVPLRPGDQELSLPLAEGVRELAIVGDAPLAAYACVPARADIPPPPPEPWQADAGLPE